MAEIKKMTLSGASPVIRGGHPEGAEPFVRKVKRGGEFLAEYTPITYTIDGVLPSGSLYGLTGKRGSAKTAFLQGMSLSVVTGRRDILGFDVEQGRVAYIVSENPDDFRAKPAVNADVDHIPYKDLNEAPAVLDMRLLHIEIVAQLDYDARSNGPFQLVCYDAFQAGFAGAAFNDNNDALKHATDLRGLTKLPGKPAVLVAAHPVKNASRDNLEPYGGGSVMNEFDGNLTLWADGKSVELGWNKVRGPEFETRFFSIEKLGSPDIKDSKGRTPNFPVLRPTSVETVEQRASAEASSDTDLIREMTPTRTEPRKTGAAPSAAARAP